MPPTPVATATRRRNASSSDAAKKKDKKQASEKKQVSEPASEEETELLSKLQALVDDGSSVRGRDADVIKREADVLAGKMEGMTITKSGGKQALELIKEIDDSAAFEKNSGRVVQVGLMIVMIVPQLLSLFEAVVEFAFRPAMGVAPADLSGMHAVVTGGCGALGLELAIMLAKSGASVVVGCREGILSQEIQAQVADLDLETGQVEVWPLQLESFEEVRNFAARVTTDLGNLDILVHSAATKQGCERTVDGHELVTQVNYLSPFLLTQLLLPSLRQAKGGRVVHVTCDSGLQRPDYLPWPLCRTQANLLPKVNLDGLGERPEGDEPLSIAGRCDSLVEYSNSKLTALVHSRELNRRLRKSRRVTAHAVNPGRYPHSDRV